MDTNHIFQVPLPFGDSTPGRTIWHIRESKRDGRSLFEVRDSMGNLVAADIASLKHACLFALAPRLLENFQLLEAEAERALWHMVDANEGYYDVEEVAEDIDGGWERTCSGAPEYAQWLLDVRSLIEYASEEH